MKKHEVVLLLNSAPFLYRDAMHFLQLSSLRKRSRKVIAFKERGIHARISVFLFHAAVEAQLNYMLYNSALTSFSEDLKKQLERLPYPIKLTEVIRHSSPLRKTVKSEKFFHELLELAELRNSFVHPKTLKYYGEGRKIKVEEGHRIRINVERTDKDSHFPISGLQRNFMLVDYRDALISKKIVNRLFLWLGKNIPGDKGNLMTMSASKSPGDLIRKSTKIEIVMEGKAENLIDFLEYYNLTKDGFGKN